MMTSRRWIVLGCVHAMVCWLPLSHGMGGVSESTYGKPSLTDMTVFGAPQPTVVTTSTSHSEYLMLLSIFMNYWLEQMVELMSYLLNFKWKMITTVFPTYQMWRGAYSEEKDAYQVCRDNVYVANKDTSASMLTELDRQACYEDMRREMQVTSGDKMLASQVSFMGSFMTKIAAVIFMVYVGVELAVDPPMDYPSSTNVAESKCWERIDNTEWGEACSVDDYTPSTVQWTECVQQCARNKACRRDGLLAFNNFTKQCIVPISDPGCKFTGSGGFRIYQKVDCPARSALTCGSLVASRSTHRQGHYSNLDESRVAECDGNGLGHVCDIYCASGHTTGEAWGHMAICALQEDGNLGWVPDGQSESLAGQQMCSPDNLHVSPGLLFNLQSDGFTAGRVKGTERDSTKPVWRDKRLQSSDPNFIFTSTWSTTLNTLDSVGPAAEQHTQFSPLRFKRTADTESATWLRGSFPLDRIIHTKTLALFAVISPSSTQDWYTFTNIVELERVFFSDGLKYGADFVKAMVTSHPMLGEATSHKVVTLLANVIDLDLIPDSVAVPIQDTVEVTLRVNGYPIMSRRVAHSCRQAFAPSSSACMAGTDTFPNTGNRFQHHGPCTASELFCSRSAIVHARSYKDTDSSFIGASVVGDSVAGVELKAYDGYIAEMAAYESRMSADVDDAENLRRIESIEWHMATKYSLRKLFAPARPSAPIVTKMKGGQTQGAVVTFPRQATAWSASETSLQVLDRTIHQDDWNKAASISIKYGTTTVFVPIVTMDKTFVFRLAVSSAAGAAVVYGFQSAPFTLLE